MTKVQGCPEPVWDGPYRFRCNLTIIDGRCGRHGLIAAVAPYTRPEYEPPAAPPLNEAPRPPEVSDE